MGKTAIIVKFQPARILIILARQIMRICKFGFVCFILYYFISFYLILFYLLPRTVVLFFSSTTWKSNQREKYLPVQQLVFSPQFQSTSHMRQIRYWWNCEKKRLSIGITLWQCYLIHPNVFIVEKSLNFDGGWKLWNVTKPRFQALNSIK